MPWKAAPAAEMDELFVRLSLCARPLTYFVTITGIINVKQTKTGAALRDFRCPFLE